MRVEILLEYFIRYGVLFLFLIVFLEHLNCPGIPAAIVMPTIGAFIAETKGNLILAVLISIAAGVFGSSVLYIIGYYLGNSFLSWFCDKFPKYNGYIEKVFLYADKYGNKGVFICRLLPIVRTLVSLVSGSLRIEFSVFLIYSAAGISIWNSIFILLGYFSAKTILG